MRSVPSKARRKKPPTFAQMRAVVLAWLAANHPDEVHVELNACCEFGGGETIATVLGPPQDIPWFTNKLKHPPEVLKQRRDAIIKQAIAEGRLTL